MQIRDDEDQLDWQENDSGDLPERVIVAGIVLVALVFLCCVVWSFQ